MTALLQQLLNALQLGSVYALIALGYTMVYGVLSMINFAHGDLFMMGAFAAFAAATFLGLSFVPTLLFSMAAIALLGVLIERLAYKPLRQAPKMSAVITALGVGIFLENITLAFNPYPRHLPELMTNTTWNAAVVPMLGIPVNRIISITFALGAGLGGAAGTLYAMAYPVIDPYMGVMIGWKAFISAVIGGIGNIRGAMLGGFLLAAVEIGVTACLPSTYRDFVAFTLLLLLLILRPWGILGKPSIEKV